MMLAFVGSGAMASIRPEHGRAPGSRPLVIGPGPSGVQEAVLSPGGAAGSWWVWENSEVFPAGSVAEDG